MIIVKISGGLGNQIFQYATARSIALKFNRKLFIDKSWFNNINRSEDAEDKNATTKRDFLLNNFSIESKILNNFYINWIDRTKIFSKSYKSFNVFSSIFLRNLSYSYFDSNNNSIKDIKAAKRAYLIGYWQNNNIIEKYKSSLLNELQLKNGLSDENKIFLKEINNTNSTAVHFRRGDYISKPNSSKLHVTCSNKYYRDAIEKLGELTTNNNYFIFSDDIEWVKSNIELPINSAYINNEETPHEDLYLMSQCKHQITANSTFSWWAAWMNPNLNKIVITPKYWYYDRSLNRTIIRIPESWIKIDNLN